MSTEPVRLTREELYEQVWSEPMAKLAQRYDLSDVGLAKICRKLRVPVPYRGYWRKKEWGSQPDARRFQGPDLGPAARPDRYPSARAGCGARRAIGYRGGRGGKRGDPGAGRSRAAHSARVLPGRAGYLQQCPHDGARGAPLLPLGSARGDTAPAGDRQARLIGAGLPPGAESGPDHRGSRGGAGDNASARERGHPIPSARSDAAVPETYLNGVQKAIDKATGKAASSHGLVYTALRAQAHKNNRGNQNGEKETIHERRHSYPKSSGRNRKGSKGVTAKYQEPQEGYGSPPCTEPGAGSPALGSKQGQGSPALGSLRPVSGRRSALVQGESLGRMVTARLPIA
jgi:hypothetical protein